MNITRFRVNYSSHVKENIMLTNRNSMYVKYAEWRRVCFNEMIATTKRKEIKKIMFPSQETGHIEKHI